MRNDVCFVCVGQCAGNIGSLLEKKGYDTLFINTADADLALLQKAKHVYKIPGERGCNQNPVKAQGVFAQYYREIMDKIIHFATKRIVYFISATGGGTSGMTPLMLDAYLEYLGNEEEKAWDAYDESYDAGRNPKPPVKRKAGFIAVLPALDESVVLNANAYNFMHQIGETIDRELGNQNTNLANGILLDNENNKDILKLNEEFVNLFDSVLKIPEKHKSVKGNIDAADLEDAITAVGITVFSELNKEEFSISSLVNSLRSSKIFAQSESDVGRYWLSSTIDEFDISALESELGAPIAHFKTYNDYTNLFALSGLCIPVERIDLMADRAEEYHAKEVRRNSETFNRNIDVRGIAPKVAPPRAMRGERNRPAGNGNGTASASGEQNPVQNSVQDKLKLIRRRRA